MKIEGNFKGKGKKFAIILARFNELITNKLLEGAMDCLLRHEVLKEDIEVYFVPGCFEIPIIAKKIALKNKHDAIIALGCVIRGATSHYDYVCSEVSKGVANVSLETQKPIIFGVLTTEDTEQALERAGTKNGNKGFEAALSAIEMANLLENI